MVSTQGGKGTKDSIVGDGVRRVRERHKGVWGGGEKGRVYRCQKSFKMGQFVNRSVNIRIG